MTDETSSLRIQINGSQAATEAKRLADALERLAKQGDRASAEAKQLGDELSKTTTKAQPLTTQLFSLKTAMAALGLGVIAKQFIETSDAMTRLNGRLALVTTSSQNLADVQRELFATSQETRTGFEATATMYARLATNAGQLGLSQRDLLSLTKTLNQAIQIGGASASEAANGVMQLSQAFGSGRLSGDEFRSVMENMPRVAQALAAGLNTDIAGLRKMAEAGELTTSRINKAMASQARTIGSEYGRLPRTVGGAMTQLANQVQIAIASADMTPLIDSIEELTETVSDPKFVEGLIDTADAIARVANAVSLVTGAVIGTAGKALGLFMDDLEKLGSDIGDLLIKMGAMDGVVGEPARLTAANEPFDVAGITGLPRTSTPAAPANYVTGGDKATRDRIIAEAARAQEQAQRDSLVRMRGTADAQLALTRDSVQRQLAELQHYYETGAVDFAGYFAKRAAIETQAIDAQIRSLRAELATLDSQAANAGDKAPQLDADRARLLAEITVLERERGDVAVQAARDQQEAEADLVQQLQAVQSELAGMRGASSGAGLRTELEAQYQQLVDRLKANSKADGVEIVQNLIDAKVAAEDMRALEDAVSRSMESMARQERSINVQSQAGLISERDARRKILDLHRQTAAELDKLLPRMRELAKTSGDPRGLQSAQRIAGDVEALSTQPVNYRDDPTARLMGIGSADDLDGATNAMLEGADALNSAFGQANQSLSEMLTNFILLGDAGDMSARKIAASMLENVLQSIIQITTATLAQQALISAGILHTAQVQSAANTEIAATAAPAAAGVTLATSGANTGMAVAGIAAVAAAMAALMGGAFAEGGNPPPGRWSLVGERGPELIKPAGAMTVLPADQTAAMLSGGGRAPNVVVNNHGQQADVSSSWDGRTLTIDMLPRLSSYVMADMARQAQRNRGPLAPRREVR